MRHAEKKKDKITLALLLCFCVIALTSIFTIRSTIDKVEKSNSNLPVSERAQTDSGEGDFAGKKDFAEKEDFEKKEENKEVSSSVPTVDSLNQQAGKESQEPTAWTYPVNASDAFVSTPFAMDNLVYSVTLDQYMTHSGVDIEAPADTQVLAIGSGTVSAIYVDDRYGNTVEIRHTPELTAVYSNLSDAHMVEIGDTVKAGQIIGGIGSTGLFESLQPAHLHFEIEKDGVLVNPLDYIE